MEASKKYLLGYKPSRRFGKCHREKLYGVATPRYRLDELRKSFLCRKVKATRNKLSGKYKYGESKDIKLQSTD